MNNITVSVDSETYRRARVIAAERCTSVSSLVREYLNGLAGQETPTARLKRQESEIRARIGDFRAGDRVSRDEVHERGA